jgi:hypothetical protein
MPNWITQLTSAAKRDPKKAVVLIALVAVLGIMWVKMFGPGKPKRASAAAVAGTGATGKTAPAPQPAPRGNSAHPALQKWADAPISPITRNLFAIKLEFFPLEGPRINSGAEKRGDEGFWAKLEKSLILQADQRDKRENQIANYRKDAAQLKLQSTIMGPSPKAMVNGELVGEGDVVANFRVVRIEARRIIIEREGIRLEIQMK